MGWGGKGEKKSLAGGKSTLVISSPLSRRQSVQNDGDVSEPNLTNLTTASQQSRKNLEAKYATVRTGKGNVFEDKISDHPKEDVFECFPTTSGKVQGFLNPSFPPPEPQRKPSSGSLENCGLTKEGATKPAFGQKENGIGIIEHAPREQKVMSILFMCTKITEVVS
ncbi:ankyrin repeat domain-containing protein 26-like [Lemur catta]|uniref:ankyrin repeat domain-containing protein 26-like n=1 Tax=Lemur catta TaxID=9447 RepID=UPI001E26CA5F|nr:ankyrin repeat domain-containing protein 26-like [Lemur catta]